MIGGSWKLRNEEGIFLVQDARAFSENDLFDSDTSWNSLVTGAIHPSASLIAWLFVLAKACSLPFFSFLRLLFTLLHSTRSTQSPSNPNLCSLHFRIRARAWPEPALPLTQIITLEANAADSDVESPIRFEHLNIVAHQ